MTSHADKPIRTGPTEHSPTCAANTHSPNQAIPRTLSNHITDPDESNPQPQSHLLF